MFSGGLILASFVCGFVVSYTTVSADALGEEIVCEVFQNLQSQGLPIPPELDATGCESGGGDPVNPPSINPPNVPGITQCSNSIDDDGDGNIDFLPGTPVGDPDCDSLADDSEATSQGGGGGGTDGDGGGGGGNPDGGGTGSGGSSGSTDGPGTSQTSGGGAAPVCSDLQDNDGDSLIDALDPGCSGVLDGDERDTESASVATTTSEVVSSAVSTISCDAYLTAFIRPRAENNSGQVERLQSVLAGEGFAVGESGVYDVVTIESVRAFQSKFADEILTPWGISEPTGFVYLTTRKKVNEIYCKSRDLFALSVDEAREINEFKGRSKTIRPLPNDDKPVIVPTPEIRVNSESAETVGGISKESQVAAGGSAEAVERPLAKILKPVRSFLSRLFQRGE